MKKHRFIVPLLFSIWPIPCGGAILLFNTILGSEATLIIVGATFPMLLLAGIIMNIIISGQYRQEEQYKQLACWGMIQKLSYIPFFIAIPQIKDIKWM